MRLAGAAATSMLLVACTHGSAHAPTGPVAGSNPPGSTGIATVASAGTATLVCDHYIDAHAPPRGFRTVLDVVALPVSPSYPALQTGRTGARSGRSRLFAKTGLVIRSRTSFEISVPTDVAHHVGIGWGGWPSKPSHKLIVSDCPSAGGSGWLSYAGGYWVDHPACVPIIVTAGAHQRRVHVGLGTPCPGQSPPDGPSDR